MTSRFSSACTVCPQWLISPVVMFTVIFVYLIALNSEKSRLSLDSK